MRLYLALLVSFLTQAAFAANVLENGSFESGDLRGWSFYAYGTGAIIPMWFTNDSAGAHHGRHYAVITKNVNDNARNYTTRIYRLKPSTTYTVSYYARSDSSDYTGREVHCYAYHYAGSSPVMNISAHTSASWQRFSGSFTTTNSASECLYQVRFINNPTTTYEYAYLDAVQLEEGESATAFTPITPIEVGAHLDRNTPGHIYHTTNTISLPLVAYNNTASASNVTVNWCVYDYWNTAKASGTNTFIVGANSSVTNNATVTLTNLGTFRLMAWINGVESSISEATFTRINPPLNIGNRTNGIFGLETYPSEWYLASLQRMGIHWNRHLSVLPFGRWDVANATEGVFVEWTNRIALERAYDVEPLGNLGLDSREVPLWATNGITTAQGAWPDNTKWSNFVYRIVSDYKPYVSWWEVWNEEVNTYPTPLTNVLTFAYGAITNADPAGKVVGAADVYDVGHHYMSNILASIGGHVITNAYTVHFYPTREENTTNALADIAPFGLQVWNSESGLKYASYHLTAWQESAIFGLDSGTSPLGAGYTRTFDSRFPMMVKNIAWTLAAGIKKFFYYDARNTGGHNGYVSYSVFDYDNTLNPMGAMLANLAYTMDNGTALGIPSLNTNVFSFAWSQSNRVAFILISTNAPTETNAAIRLAITSSLPANQVTFYDIFGNAKPAGTVLFGREPIYLRGADGVASNTLAESLTIYRTNDTTGPQVVVANWPTAASTGGFQFRWNGLDDSSLSSWWVSNTNATRYAYRVDSGAWSAYQNAHWANVTLAGNETSFSVAAVDPAGNATTNTISLLAGTPDPQPEPTPGTNSISTKGQFKLRGKFRVR